MDEPIAAFRPLGGEISVVFSDIQAFPAGQVNRSRMANGAVHQIGSAFIAFAAKRPLFLNEGSVMEVPDVGAPR